MVLRLCRRVLQNEQDAEDAFQATFLILIHKAASLLPRDSLSGWLYTVAYRVAQKIRIDAARRRKYEARQAVTQEADPLRQMTVREAQEILDRELVRLPNKFRVPLVLCYLEGLTRDEAAKQLGLPPSTLKSRLEQAREQLRARLAWRGLALGGALVALTFSEGTGSAALPSILVDTTLAAAKAVAAGGAMASLVSTQVAVISSRPAVLAEGVLRAMCFVKLKIALAVVLMVGMAGAGAVVGWQQAAATMPPEMNQTGLLNSAPQQTSRPPGPEQPRIALDRYGDPLPPEAISRLGTVRLRHGGFTTKVRFTPDGKTILSKGDDGIRTWDVATGKQVYVLPKETTGRIDGAMLFPDGKQVITANPTGLHVWDLASGSRLRTLATEHYVILRSSPDAGVLGVVPILRNQMELLDVHSGQRLWSWSHLNQSLADIAFAADGKTVITAGWAVHPSPPLANNTIRFLDARTGREQRQIDLGTRRPNRIASSPDGKLLAVICQDDKVSVFELASGKERFHLVQPGPGSHGQRFFSAACFTPDSKSLVTAGGERSLLVWELTTGKLLRRLGHDMTNSYGITFSPDGRRLAVANCMKIRVIDWENGEDLLPVAGHPNVVYQAIITPDSKTVITASGSTAILWDAMTGQERKRWESGGPLEPFYPFHLADDGRTVLTLSFREKILHIRDLPTGKERFRISLDFIAKQPSVKGIGSGGKLVVVGDFSGDTVWLVDAEAGKVVRSFPDPGRMVQHAEIGDHGRTLVTYRDNHTAQIWDIATGARLRQIGPMGEVGPVSVDGWGLSYAATLSPDGKWLAYGSPTPAHPYVLLLDVATGQVIRRLDNLSGNPHLLAFSPDSRVLAWAGGPVIHFLELATGRERHSLTGYRGYLLSLCFSADRKRLVSGGSDTTALVWDLTGSLGSDGAWGKPLSNPDLEAYWTALADVDAARAYRAMRKLAASPAQVVRYLGQRLRPVQPADEKRLKRLMAELDNNQFPVREKAAKELERLGELAVPACRKALEGKPALDLRRRLETLIENQAQAWSNPSPGRLQSLRAIEVLESIATPQARNVLEGLAKGTAEARVTQEAQAALERLATSRGLPAQ
jgi:RNA polymerase sigma factor (sigma-70 family)